jgi:hypothetical protein
MKCVGNLSLWKEREETSKIDWFHDSSVVFTLTRLYLYLDLPTPQKSDFPRLMRPACSFCEFCVKVLGGWKARPLFQLVHTSCWAPLLALCPVCLLTQPPDITFSSRWDLWRLTDWLKYWQMGVSSGEKVSENYFPLNHISLRSMTKWIWLLSWAL